MLYFEDIEPGQVSRSSTYSVETDEMVEFARRWDPVPMHIDPAVADATADVTPARWLRTHLPLGPRQVRQ